MLLSFERKSGILTTSQAAKTCWSEKYYFDILLPCDTFENDIFAT